jgi:uncharacterized protein (DUF934 family)
MALIKDGALAEDTWRTLTDDDPLTGDEPIIVSYDRWQAERDRLSRHNGPLGIRLNSDQPPSLIENDIGRFELIALNFPTMGDGRAYSYARILRERMKFGGELRAVGDITKDLLFFLHRCGFNSFDMPKGRDPQDALGALHSFSVVYAQSADDQTPAYRRRGQNRKG